MGSVDSIDSVDNIDIGVYLDRYLVRSEGGSGLLLLGALCLLAVLLRLAAA